MYPDRGPTAIGIPRTVHLHPKTSSRRWGSPKGRWTSSCRNLWKSNSNQACRTRPSASKKGRPPQARRILPKSTPKRCPSPQVFRSPHGSGIPGMHRERRRRSGFGAESIYRSRFPRSKDPRNRSGRSGSRGLLQPGQGNLVCLLWLGRSKRTIRSPKPDGKCQIGERFRPSRSTRRDPNLGKAGAGRGHRWWSAGKGPLKNSLSGESLRQAPPGEEPIPTTKAEHGRAAAMEWVWIQREAAKNPKQDGGYPNGTSPCALALALAVGPLRRGRPPGPGAVRSTRDPR
jgi:hypothetical protein